MTDYQAHIGMLVRDKLPDQIRGEGKVREVRRIGGAEHEIALCDRIVEELIALRETGDPRRLAEVQQLVNDLMRYFCTTPDDVEMVRSSRERAEGGYSRGYVLESVDDMPKGPA